VVSPWQYPLLPGGLGRKLKNSNHYKVDTARHSLPVGKAENMLNILLPFTLINCQHIKSFPNQFRLHTIARSLGLPVPLFWQKFHFIGSIF